MWYYPVYLICRTNLINLLINAIQAVGKKADARINLNAFLNNQGRVIIEVEDNGPGIPDEVKEKIFIPFFTTKKDGSGIGLSLSRQIMRLHRGTINVNSIPGKKTVFTLKWPSIKGTPKIAMKYRNKRILFFSILKSWKSPFNTVTPKVNSIIYIGIDAPVSCGTYS